MREWYAWDGEGGAGAAIGGEGGLQRGARIQGTLEADTGTLYSLTVRGPLEIGDGGKIIDAEGSYWDRDGITLAGTPSTGDAITFKAGSDTVGKLYTLAGTMKLQATDGASLYSSLQLTTTTAFLEGVSGVTISAAGLQTSLNANGDLSLARRLYPGTATGAQQASRYILDNGSQIEFVGNVSFGNFTVRLGTSGASGVMPDATKALPIVDHATGALRFIPVYTSASPWTV